MFMVCQAGWRDTPLSALQVYSPCISRDIFNSSNISPEIYKYINIYSPCISQDIFNSYNKSPEIYLFYIPIVTCM